MLQMLREAIAASAATLCEKAAQIWADGFTFPEEARVRDKNLLLEGGGDFHKLREAKRALGAAERLSVARVMEMVGSKRRLKVKKDFQRLLAIARGIVIETPKDFKPSGGVKRPEMRKKYVLEVPNCVNKLLYIQWQ